MYYPKKKSCSCATKVSNKQTGKHTKKVNALNILSAVVFFLFPKCAFCWAAYASFFSFIGFEKLAYNSKWKYIILFVFLLGSVVLMWKHYKNKSWINIILYTSGLSILLIAYYLNYSQNWWLYIVAFLMILSNFHLEKKQALSHS
ncbi:hypothetical protein SAMN04487910_1507 [Aquimarina amphilecti]|uniref:MerC mercury resistance protein n=1 Tax=Aquimarina amphilecti TaxID=1038014 RepID=A0A1H7L2Q7_AQUAM|nr:hypothetical protein [Aquimarina amphilecti]SEK93281.1 hypothetical protein SAMN04487910_1507 [Aquimarina amphilecti]